MPGVGLLVARDKGILSSSQEVDDAEKKGKKKKKANEARVQKKGRRKVRRRKRIPFPESKGSQDVESERKSALAGMG